MKRKRRACSGLGRGRGAAFYDGGTETYTGQASDLGLFYGNVRGGEKYRAALNRIKYPPPPLPVGTPQRRGAPHRHADLLRTATRHREGVLQPDRARLHDGALQRNGAHLAEEQIGAGVVQRAFDIHVATQPVAAAAPHRTAPQSATQLGIYTVTLRSLSSATNSLPPTPTIRRYLPLPLHHTALARQVWRSSCLAQHSTVPTIMMRSSWSLVPRILPSPPMMLRSWPCNRTEPRRIPKRCEARCQSTAARRCTP